MWAQLISTLVGIWLMAAPQVLGYAGSRAAADNHHVVGPLVATFAVIALWQVTRPLRWLNLLLGLWLIVSPIILSHPPVAMAHSVVGGAVVVAMSLIRGRLNKRYGGGWSQLWRANPTG